MPRPKNSAEYWKWRQAKRMYEQMEQADKVGEDISRIYAQASAQIEGEIERIFFTYQQKWGLSKAEAKRLLKKVRGKNTVDVLKAMLPHVDEAVREEFKAQIESGAYAARIKRLEDLQGNLDKVMRDVYKQDEQRQREHYVQFAEESYNREIYEIQKQVGFQFEFNELSEEAIDMVLNRKWCGESFSDAIWKNTQKVADEVRDVLLIELMTGQRQEDAVRALAERMAVGAMQSRRIIRTESNYISGQVQLQAYEECGAEKYLYVATLDSRTDEECGMLDGKTFFVKDAQPGVDFHPMHPNCRCTDIIALDDDTLKNLQRRARDPETGENELVPAGTTWEEWRKQNYLNEPKKVRDIASNFYKKGIAKNKDDAMNMARLFDKYHKSNDPGLLIDGPISESHPEEMERILKEAEEKGVEIRFSRGSTAYAPGIRPGEPGQLHLMPTDSYSAWLHEEQHMLDEEKDGWPGYRALEDIDRRTRMEYNAYRREIEYAESCGRPDVADMHKEAFRKEVISFGGEPIEI